jgi:hypothetical protein
VTTTIDNLLDLLTDLKKRIGLLERRPTPVIVPTVPGQPVNALAANINTAVPLASSTNTPQNNYDTILSNTLPEVTFDPVAGTVTFNVTGNYRVFAQAEFQIGVTTAAKVVSIQKALAATPTTFATYRNNSGFAASTSQLPTFPVTDQNAYQAGDVIRISVQSNVALSLNSLMLSVEKL